MRSVQQTLYACRRLILHHLRQVRLLVPSSGKPSLRLSASQTRRKDGVSKNAF